MGLRDGAHVLGGARRRPEGAPPGRHVDHLAEADERVSCEEQQQEGELVRGLGPKPALVGLLRAPDRGIRERLLVPVHAPMDLEWRQGVVEELTVKSGPSDRTKQLRLAPPVPLGHLDGSVQLGQRHEQVDVGCLARADVAVHGLGESRALERDDRNAARNEVGREALREAVMEEPAVAGAHPHGPDTSRRALGEVELGVSEQQPAQGGNEGLWGEDVEQRVEVDLGRQRPYGVHTLRRRVGCEAHECHHHVPLDHAGSLISTR